MEDKKEVTVIDVLTDSVKTLSNLAIPVGLIQPIGLQISRVIGNLNAAIEAINKNEETNSEDK